MTPDEKRDRYQELDHTPGRTPEQEAEFCTLQDELVRMLNRNLAAASERVRRETAEIAEQNRVLRDVLARKAALQERYAALLRNLEAEESAIDTELRTALAAAPAGLSD